MIQLPKGAPSAKRLAIGAGVVLMLILGMIWLFGGGKKEPGTAGGDAPPIAAVPVPPSPSAGDRDVRVPPSPSRPRPPAVPETSPPEPRPAPRARDEGQLRGMVFLDAIIDPLQNELDRFWGWRPNDIIQPTDNVNNYQLGVLEATRRTSIVLAERISRTGSSAPYVRELEQAMSMFAIDPTNWIFPRPEVKYREGLDNIRAYQEMLKRGEARFHNRMDNLVPLILVYKSLLESCIENLLRKDVSFFKIDDIFFYSQGVSAMMLSAMEGVGVDFRDPIESAQSIEVYEGIMFSLRQVVEMRPPVILDGSPRSIWANHRANMAGPMSRARFLMRILYGALTGDL